MLSSQVTEVVAQLEAAGWHLRFAYSTGTKSSWVADRFVVPGDPLCPPTDQDKVLVQYSAGDIFQLAKTCGVEL